MPKKAKPVRAGEEARHVSVVLDADLIRAIDAEAERLAKELRLRLTRADVIRRWLEDGAERSKSRGK